MNMPKIPVSIVALIAMENIIYVCRTLEYYAHASSNPIQFNLLATTEREMMFH